MASGDSDETRAYARLPGLDIAVIHRGAHGGGWEEVMVAVRAVPSFGAFGRPVGAVDPLLLWTRFAQVMWASWLGCLAAASTPPWIAKGD